MQLTFQLVIKSDDQPHVITELLCVERSTVDPGSVALHLREALELLSHRQTAMVTAQVESFIATASQRPSFHRHLGCKGLHELVYRTVLGTLHLDSPRFYHCPACPGKVNPFQSARNLPARAHQSGVAVFTDKICLTDVVWFNR